MGCATCGNAGGGEICVELSPTPLARRWRDSYRNRYGAVESRGKVISTWLCPVCGGSGDQQNPLPITDELRRHVEAVWRRIA